jgi:hypothetical protein
MFRIEEGVAGDVGDVVGVDESEVIMGIMLRLLSKRGEDCVRRCREFKSPG